MILIFPKPGIATLIQHASGTCEKLWSSFIYQQSEEKEMTNTDGLLSMPLDHIQKSDKPAKEGSSELGFKVWRSESCWSLALVSNTAGCMRSNSVTKSGTDLNRCIKNMSQCRALLSYFIAIAIGVQPQLKLSVVWLENCLETKETWFACISCSCPR